MKSEDYNKLDTDTRISYWLGRLLVAIGRGDIRSELYLMIDFLTRDAYERGAADAKAGK